MVEKRVLRGFVLEKTRVEISIIGGRVQEFTFGRLHSRSWIKEPRITDIWMVLSLLDMMVCEFKMVIITFTVAMRMSGEYSSRCPSTILTS